MPQILGYARVSTEEQILDMQTTALKVAGCHRIFAEKVSAVNLKRPQFHLMMKHVECGDTIVVYSFSRLSRDLKFLLGFIDDMRRLGVTVRSTSEPHIDPFTTSGRLVLSLTGAIDENERGRTRDRTKDAMAEKVRQGMYLGRPRLIDAADIKAMKKLRKSGIAVPAIAKQFGIKPSTVYANTR